MPVSPDQLTADVDFLTSQPDWQDEQTRGDYIRNLAVNSRSNVEPEEHRAVIGKLWELADDRSLARKGAEFVGTAVEEVAKSAVAIPVAAGMALTDAVGMTDTGSGTRLVEGVKNLVDQTGQVVKQAMPGKSKQAERDELLGFLKQDLDEGAVPDELENWLAGAYDGQDLPEPLQPWVDGLSRGIAKKAVAADFSGDVPPEKVNAWLTTDRNPLFSDSDDGTPGPRELLADYVATRDPKSWEAFQSRVTETDQQYQTRVRRALTEQQFQADVKGVGGFTGEMIGRAADMQTSPIDLATAVLPVLRGSKALMAARAGKAGLAKDLAIGATKEGVQEGVTEKLTDARASAMDVAEAAAMGAIGGGALEGGMAGAGALTRQLSRPTSSPTVEGDLSGAPVSVPESERSPGMTGLEEDTGDLALDDVADLEAAPADARFMPPPDLTAGLTDLGTVEGDLLTDARFRPPPQAQAQTPAANVDLSALRERTAQLLVGSAQAPAANVDLSAGTNLARATPAELAPLGTDQDVAAAEARLAAAQDGREQRLAQADLAAARSGVGPVAQAVNSARRAAVDLAIANREPVAAEAMDIYARTPINAVDEAGNIQMQGMPAGYVQRSDQFVFEEAAPATVNESLSVQDEAQTAQADAVIAQQAQARGLRPPAPGTVSRQGSALPFEEIVGMAAAAIRSGVTNFSAWATAMVRRFGQAVRRYLAGAWQAATAAANRAAKAPVTFGQRPLDRRARAGEGGFTGGSPLGQDGPPNLAETRSRFARPDAAERLKEVRADATVRQQAEAWLDSLSMEQAVAAMEAGRLPASMTMDVAQQAAGLILQRTTAALRTGTEVQQMQSRALGHRMSRVWQGWLSQEASRSLRQRGVVNAELVPYAPILAAEGLLIDRAEAVVDKRFEGGGNGVVAKITSILSDAQTDISERVERILQAVMGARMSPRVTLREAVANLVNGRTQRDQMIDDVAKALLQRARTRQVKPEQQTALAALVASLKRTLGAAVKGESLKPDALPFGELLARTFVDQVAEAPLFEEAWKAGREQVRVMLIELGMSEADAVKRLNELMPATPTVAYAPGMVKQAVQRGFEAAGYGQTLETQMDRTGTREVDVRAEALRDPRKAQAAVMRIWDEEAQAAGISPEAWMQGRQLASKALAETMQQWQEQAAKAKEKAEQAQRDRLMAKDSPSLGKLLKELVTKIAPGMTWADIFMELPSTQRERQRAIYQRLMLDERLRGLTADERLKLTNELDKAWQRERRKVFNRELQRVGVLGEKGLADRVKIQKAMPKLLRLINLGMMNSEMFREAIAPQYGLRMISSADAVGLRKLAEEAWALPEGVLRNRKLAEMLDSIQRATGGSMAEILNSYWVASVLSGLRTMFDTFMAVTTGFGTALTQQGMLLARGKGRAAWQAHGQWWRGLGQGLDESFGILWNGDYRFQKRFNEDLRRAMDGESTFRPVPLGEALWRQGGLWKFPAAVMLWTGRLMAAADHINNTATTHGAMAVARALNPELYAGKAGFTPQERAAAQAQALNEVTGGTSPTTADERRTVSVRTREILHGLLKPETRTEANFIGDESAYQNDPIGILGGLYQMFNAGLGLGERLTLAAAQRIDGQGPGAGFARGAMAFAAGALRSATGTKFARFGANFGNHIWSFVPGSYLMSRGGQALGNLERTRSQNDLLLGRNVIGLALGASTFALLGDKDDEEDGLHLEGSWSGLSFEEKAQRRSAGFEPLTMWWRDGDKIQRLSYKSWPTAGIFAGVGAYADERRFQPARAASRGWAGHLLHAAGAGALMIKDVNALRSLAELFGASASSSDPEADLFKRMGRIPTNFVGGFVPTGVKDLDALRDPRSYKAEGVWEELARSVPGLRQTVNGGRPSITLLGDPIYFDRKPWSRAFTSAESTEPYRVLGVLNSRGLSVPAASTERYVWHNGSKVQIKSLGREAEYKYVKAVGKGYKEWLATEGRDLLSQPPEAAARQIRLQSERIKLMATLQAFGPD